MVIAGTGLPAMTSVPGKFGGYRCRDFGKDFGLESLPYGFVLGEGLRGRPGPDVFGEGTGFEPAVRMAQKARPQFPQGI